MFRHVFRSLAAAIVLCVAALSASGAAAPSPVVKAKVKPKVEVVFCLDTTGSMGGLIDGAKAKIWAICNQIAGGRPTPDLKVGLVAYRDRGDAYITKVYGLTDDLDSVHTNLKTFQAQGGGDAPESVNQALFDSVHKIGWSKDAKTLRIVFLVGDAPPHMDYPDDVKYPVTCKKACEMGIIINTIQCGNDPECKRCWQDICKKAEGAYVAIAQDGGNVAVINTPWDARLGQLNRELANTCLVWGTPTMQKDGLMQAQSAGALAAPVAAERIAYQAKNAQVAAFDLLDNINAKRVVLEKVKKDELPPVMQKMTLPEQKAYLAKLDGRRKVLNAEVLDLDQKRNAFIRTKQAEEAKLGRTSFDRQVLEMLQRQARRHHIEY